MEEKDNIIKFSKRNEISESEINSLFLGLIKLIKNKAQEDVEIKLKRECAFVTERNLYLEEKLKALERENQKLIDINKTLNKKISVLNKNIKDNI